MVRGQNWQALLAVMRRVTGPWEPLRARRRSDRVRWALWKDCSAAGRDWRGRHDSREPVTRLAGVPSQEVAARGHRCRQIREPSGIWQDLQVWLVP